MNKVEPTLDPKSMVGVELEIIMNFNLEIKRALLAVELCDSNNQRRPERVAMLSSLCKAKKEFIEALPGYKEFWTDASKWFLLNE